MQSLQVFEALNCGVVGRDKWLLLLFFSKGWKVNSDKDQEEKSYEMEKYLVWDKCRQTQVPQPQGIQTWTTHLSPSTPLLSSI